MNIFLLSREKEVLEAAIQYLGDRYKPAKKAEMTVEYRTNLNEEDGVELLRELLTRFPTLSVRGSITKDDENDRSFWHVREYKSVRDKDGKCRLESSSSTYWA